MVAQVLLPLWVLAALWPGVIVTTREAAASEAAENVAKQVLAPSGAPNSQPEPATELEEADDRLSDTASDVLATDSPSADQLMELEDVLDSTKKQLEQSAADPDLEQGATQIAMAEDKLQAAIVEIDREVQAREGANGVGGADSGESGMDELQVAIEEAASALEMAIEDVNAASSVDVSQRRIKDASNTVSELEQILQDTTAADEVKLGRVNALEAALLDADQHLDAVDDDATIANVARDTVREVAVDDALAEVEEIRTAVVNGQEDDALESLVRVAGNLDTVDGKLREANDIVTDDVAREKVAAVEVITQVVDQQQGRARVQLHPFGKLNHHFMLGKDMLLFFVALTAGVLGGSLMSLIRYTAPGEDEEWTRFRGLIGGGLALVGYFVIRGGLLQVGPDSANLNPYTIAAVAAIAGMYSTPITRKLARLAGLLAEP